METKCLELRYGDKVEKIVYWGVQNLKTDIVVSTGNRKEEQSAIKLSWFDGMVGAMPIFDTEENARKYQETRAHPCTELLKITMNQDMEIK